MSPSYNASLLEENKHEEGILKEEQRQKEHMLLKKGRRTFIAFFSVLFFIYNKILLCLIYVPRMFGFPNDRNTINYATSLALYP